MRLLTDDDLRKMSVWLEVLHDEIDLPAKSCHGSGIQTQSADSGHIRAVSPHSTDGDSLHMIAHISKYCLLGLLSGDTEGVID